MASAVETTEIGGRKLIVVERYDRIVSPNGSVERIHQEDFSLLHNASGSLALTPLYDLICTLYYGDDQLAMYIDNVHRMDRVTVERIVNEAVQ